MATINRNKDLNQSTDCSFLNIGQKFERKVLIDNLLNICKLEGLNDEVIKDLESYAWSMLTSFIGKYSRLKSNKCRKEFRDASKRHQRELNTILSQIVECLSEPSNELKITYFNNTVIVMINSMKITDVDVHPRSFSVWYNSLKLLNRYWDIPNQHKLVICRILTTLFSVVNEPVLFPEEKEEMVLEVLNALSSKAQFVEPDEYLGPTTDTHQYKEFIDDIKETIYLIKHYLDIPLRDVPLWAKSIVSSINRVRRNNRLYMFDNTCPVLSSNSSGTSIKVNGKRITLPALFASVLEDDYCSDNELIRQFDNIVGFNLKYNISDEIREKLSSRSIRRRSSAIDQKKPKPRVIHILNNSEQDRLSYFHNILASVLTNLQEDCTFDQTKGPFFIRKTMKDNPKRAIYSLDLTSASDNFNIGLQYLIIKELLLSHHKDCEVLAQSWYYLMTQDSVYKDINGNDINVHFHSGQAQGYLSSFPAFALEHHIVVLTTLRKWSNDLTPSSFYRVLGDDLVICCDDPEFKVPGLYLKYINAANVECNLTKGYIYNIYKPQYTNKIAEFAKYLLIDGYDLTPIPFKLLMASNLSEQLGLLSWLSIHRQERYSINNVIYYLNNWSSFFGKAAAPILGILTLLNIPGVITQSFKREFKKLENYNLIDFKILREVLFHNIIYGVINRLTSNKPFEPNLKSLIHLTGELKVLYKYIDNPLYIDTNNKLSILRDNLYNTNNILSEYIKNYSSFDQLDDETIEIISMYLCTNNDRVVKDKLISLTNSLNILLEDIDNIEYSGVNEYYMKGIRLLSEFNITIDRSWSTYDRKAPNEYLSSLGKIIKSSLFEDGYNSIEDYLNEYNLSIEPISIPVLIDNDINTNFSFIFDDDSVFC